MTDTALWNLPDAVLVQIVSFVAAPTHRAEVLCHQLAPLCSSAAETLLNEESTVWDVVLNEDYGASCLNANQRRASKRLRRSPIHRVRDAHLLIKDNTEIAFFYLSELVNSKSLSLYKMVGVLDEYGPHLRINSTVSSGGIFLVEICRARKVKESTILRCVEELIRRGSLVDLQTSESAGSRQTALSVAAARGMPSVVKFLLLQNASRELRSSGRFQVHSNKKRTIHLRDSLPIDCAKTMMDAEVEAGASTCELKALTKCIRLLEGKT